MNIKSLNEHITEINKKIKIYRLDKKVIDLIKTSDDKNEYKLFDLLALKYKNNLTSDQIRFFNLNIGKT